MKSLRPSILFLSSSWPHGKAFGGQLRALHIGRCLRQIGDVTLSVVSSDSADEEAQQKSAEEFQLAPQIFPEISPNRGIAQRLRWALDPRHLNVHGCVAPPADRERIRSSLSQYDLAWVFNSRTPNILGIWRWPHSHLDVDDVPSTYLRAISRNGNGFTGRWMARLQCSLSKRRELLFNRRFATLSVCSEADRSHLGGGRHIHVIPNGFERPRAVPLPSPATDPPRIGFIGLYTYAPNLEGVRWFLEKSWPAILRAVPGVRFRLVGKGTDGPLQPTDANIDALGWIDDPAREIATWSAMVVPIRFGGGTRVKIADAFSRKCPVVSTPLGAFGYDVEDGKQLRLADSPEDFARACVDLIQDRTRAAKMAEQAWTEFLERWTWDAIAPSVWSAAEDCLRRGGERASK